jgi:hypothetical protein
MSNLEKFLAGDPQELALTFRKKKRVEPEKPNAAVVQLPQGQALSVAKSERTRASEYDREAEKARRWDEERQRRTEAYLNSPAYQAAAERFNASLQREREENWFDPTQPFGFRR